MTEQDKLTASEAVYGVLAWLTTRQEPLTVGSGHECGIVANLAEEFCNVNHLQPPRERWENNLIHPSGECSQINDEPEAIKQKFADFAKECGLEEFPDPSGERYVYGTDLEFAGKKIEYTGLIDDLWNALARSNGREDLCVPIDE